mgnify:CR=1 FL=1
MIIKIKNGYNEIFLEVEDMADAMEVMNVLMPRCEEGTSFSLLKVVKEVEGK